MKCGFFF
jgi:alkanesulfonate monooxygenase SsuD/methylene tetrahydromethanopterin reductase-like flavin-dependent oxidoreductase (luciferase family)